MLLLHARMAWPQRGVYPGGVYLATTLQQSMHLLGLYFIILPTTPLRVNGPNYHCAAPSPPTLRIPLESTQPVWCFRSLVSEAQGTAAETTGAADPKGPHVMHMGGTVKLCQTDYPDVYKF